MSPAVHASQTFVLITVPQDGTGVSTNSVNYVQGQGQAVLTNVDDNNPPVHEDFYINGVFYKSVTYPTTGIFWNILAYPNGPYTIQARAYDSSGNYGSSSVTVTLQNPDTTPPTVTVTSPTAGQTISGTIRVVVHVQDYSYTTTGIKSVIAYVQGYGNIGTDTACSANCGTGYGDYYFTLNSASYANGNYNLYAISYDNMMNLGISPNVGVTMNNGGATTYTVTFSESGLPSATSWNVVFNGQSYTSTSSSIAIPNVAAGTYCWSTATPIAGTSGIQYIASPASGSLSVTSSTTQSITYSTQYYLTTQVSPAGAGTISPASEWLAAGSSVQVTATANSGYQFSSWTGSGVGSYTGSSNPATLTMNGPVTEISTFNAVASTATVTFLQSGISASSGTVLTVDGVPYASVGTGLSFTWTIGSSHTFAWSTPVSGGTGTGTRFVWSSSAGLSTAQSGSITVPSLGGSLTASYLTQYQVVFSDSPAGGGLTSPSGSAWYTSGASISIAATPASGYTFSSWTSSTCSITFGSSTSGTTSATVNGAGTITANFVISTSSVTFTENGLLTGTSWSVTFNGVASSSTTTSIIFSNVATSSYSWSTPSTIGCGSGCQYAASPTSGTMNVPTQTSQTVSYSKQYQVSFASSPTAGGTTNPTTTAWYNSGASISISTTASSGYTFSSWTSSTTSITFASTISASTTVSINAAGTITANFALAAYVVTFTQSSLPTGTTWSVTYNGATTTSSTPTITFNVNSGSYSWTTTTPKVSNCNYVPSPSSGTMSVPTQTSQALSYTASCSMQFTESNLPTGTSWSITYNGFSLSSTSTTMTFTGVPAGSHAFSVASIMVGSCVYASSPVSGSLDPTALSSQSISFSPACSLTFSETGLPAGTSWSVTLSGQIYSSSTSTVIVSSVASGTYSWTATTPIVGVAATQYVTSTSSGSMSVPAQTSQSVSYTTQYQLTTVQSPAGGGTTSPTSVWYNSGSLAQVSATLAAGYTFGGWTGVGTGSYTGSLNPATVTMNGPITETATFTQSVPAYTVTFTQSGLPTGTAWSVTFNGATLASASTSITFTDVNSGSYTWTADSSTMSNCSYAAFPSGGNMSVPTETSQAITYSASCTVTFTESNLPSGASWSVTYNGVTASSAAALIVFSGIPPGAHSFSVSSLTSGACTYSPTPSSGSVDPTLSGGQSVAYSSACSITFTENGLPSGTSWSVAFDGTTLSSTASAIAFANVNSGTHSWSTPSVISCGTGCQYWATPTEGSLSVPTQLSQALVYSQKYQVALASSPSSGGSTSPTSGSSTWVSLGGSLAITATPSTGYQFYSWSSGTSSITFASSSSASTNALVVGQGTITADFIASVSLQLSPATLSVVAGSSTSLTATVSGGAQSVMLSTSSLPSGITLSFAANPCSDSSLGVQDTITVSATGTSAPGTYSITVSATGTNGQSSWTTLTLEVRDGPLVVNITSPTSGSTVSGTVGVTVTASSPAGLAKLQLWVNGALYKQARVSGTSTRTSFSWGTSKYAPGVYTLVAKAYDKTGNVGTYSTSVTVVSKSPKSSPKTAVASSAGAPLAFLGSGLELTAESMGVSVSVLAAVLSVITTLVLVVGVILARRLPKSFAGI